MRFGGVTVDEDGCIVYEGTIEVAGIEIPSVRVDVVGNYYYFRGPRTIELHRGVLRRLERGLLKLPPERREWAFWRAQAVVTFAVFDLRRWLDPLVRYGGIKRTGGKEYAYVSEEVPVYSWEARWNRAERLRELGAVRFAEEVDGARLYVGVDEEAKRLFSKIEFGTVVLSKLPRRVRTYEDLKIWLRAKEFSGQR